MPNTLTIPKVLYREGTSKANLDGTFRLSVSSDVPYLRYDMFTGEEYYEVLSHETNGMDLSRFTGGAALLYNHQRDVQLGTLDAPQVSNGKCYVNARLSAAADVSGHITRIKEGILKDTSVGYSVNDEGTKIGTKDGKPIYKFRWQPHEASFVTIAADITVGMGRTARKHSTKH